MMAAVLRLVLITVSALTLTFFALFLVRQLGLQQSFAAPPHKWSEIPEWKIVAPSAQKLCKPEPFTIAADEIIAVPVRPIESGWTIDCPDKNQKLELKEWLAHVPFVNILLQVHASEAQNLDNLVDSVGSFDKEKYFGVVSSSQKVSRALRKKAPQWLYAADPASLLRLQIFTSMWIETAMDFWPDFVIAGENEDPQSSHLTPRLIDELARRQKRVIWADEKTKPPFPVHGILTAR